ncbi:hypothetical protein DTO027B5_7349 [Paecilomyces variotii]|nr:hypothetical protein DTO027B3_4558 [Paecilomyces variotii]KAJ9330922.1 hypothetical protein DTO027B5_7349 [Paecilomyces variotii]
MDILGFPEPHELVIGSRQAQPGWLLTQELIEKLTMPAWKAQGRSVVVVHYAGHGAASAGGDELLLTNSSGKVMKASAVLQAFQTYDDQVDVDILVIFDCCWSFLASRTMKPGARLVEIITAGDERDPIAFESTVKASLTSKLFIEIRQRAQMCHQYVEFTDVISELRRISPLKKPCHASLLGVGSIKLPLNPNSAAMSNSIMGLINQPVAHLAATFSIHVSYTYDAQQLEQLSAWIANLEGDCTLKLEYVKETNSMLFIFEAPYTAFLRIQGLPGVTFLAEHKPSSPPVQHREASSGRIVGIENMPPNIDVSKLS